MSSATTWAACCATASPSYRLPRERLQAEIDWILSAGIDVELDHSVSGEELARLRDEFDAVYPGHRCPQ